MRTYTGIIDDYGMESFVLSKTNKFPFNLRDSLNTHRNAVAYEVDLGPDETDKVSEMMLEKDWKRAGKYLKSRKSFREL